MDANHGERVLVIEPNVGVSPPENAMARAKAALRFAVGKDFPISVKIHRSSFASITTALMGLARQQGVGPSHVQKAAIKAANEGEQIAFSDFLYAYAADAIMAYFDEYPDGVLTGYDSDDILAPEEVAPCVWHDAMTYAVDVLLDDKLRRLPYHDEDVHCLATMYDTIVADMKDRGELKPCEPGDEWEEIGWDCGDSEAYAPVVETEAQ